MKLSNAKLQYNENGAFVDVQGLKSCDVSFTTSGSRSQWSREGTYTNEAIDTFEINFERGLNTLLDGLALQSEVPLKWNNGALAYEGIFVVNNKINKKENGKTITFISFIPKLGESITIKARGGEGGHVDDVEVDGVSCVSGGVAEIELAPYAKKTEVEATYAKQADLTAETTRATLKENEIIDEVEVAKTDIENLSNDKQDILTAGKGIIITSDNTIEATGEAYTSGDGIKIDAAEIAVDRDTVPTVNNSTLTGTSSIENITLSGDATMGTTGSTIDFQNASTVHLGQNAVCVVDPTVATDETVVNKLYTDTKVEEEAQTRSEADDQIRTTVTDEVARAEAQEAALQAQISSLGGIVQVQVVATQPDTPVNNTIYYIGTSNPYAVKLYTNDTWYEMGSSTLDLSQYARLDGTNTTYTGDITLDGAAITSGDCNVVKKMGNIIEVGDYYDAGVTVNELHLKTKLDHADITLRSDDSYGDISILANKGVAIETPELVQFVDGSPYQILTGERVRRVVTLTQDEYEAISPKHPEYLYAITDGGKGLFLGETEICSGGAAAIKQEMYDGIFPVDSIHFGFQAPGIPNGVTATWKDISDTYSTRYLKIDKSYVPGSFEDEQLPKPTIESNGSHNHSISNLTGSTKSAGGHTHDRGTMEITGDFATAPSGGVVDSLPIKRSTGAFYNAGTKGDIKKQITDINASYDRASAGAVVGFKASSSWSGSTSTSGSHTHDVESISGSTADAGSHNHTIATKGPYVDSPSGENARWVAVRPQTVTIRIWQRTA